MSIITHETTKVASLLRLVELAEQKKAVVFNGGIVKPAAVVLHMQGATIAKMIREGNLFEYIKPVSEKKPLIFYRSRKVKRGTYEALGKENKEMKSVAAPEKSEPEKAEATTLPPETVTIVIDPDPIGADEAVKPKPYSPLTGRYCPADCTNLAWTTRTRPYCGVLKGILEFTEDSTDKRLAIMPRNCPICYFCRTLTTHDDLTTPHRHDT